MKKTVLTLSLVGAVAACVPAQPIVSEFNGDSVQIVTSAFSPVEESKVAAQAEATRICRAGGKTRAEYASTRSNQQTYESYHLYLCL